MMEIEPASRKEAITIRGLVKRYHFRPVLNSLTFNLKDGDFCVLVGANGAGKTTLLRILAGLAQPNQGDVLIDGLALKSSPNTRKAIGYIGHQPMFYEDLTALENLWHYARLYGVNQPKTVAIIHHAVMGTYRRSSRYWKNPVSSPITGNKT